MSAISVFRAGCTARKITGRTLSISLPYQSTVAESCNTTFRAADRFRWGTAGRNVVIGPGINNWDFSLFKNFQIDEKRKVQFRSEFFNGFNRAEFAAPGATIGTAQFGRISATTRDPRDIQLSLKFLW